MPNLNKVMLMASILGAYESGKSLPEVSALCDVPQSTCRNLMIMAGASLRSRAMSIRLASPKLSALRKGRKRPPFSEEHRRKLSEARKGTGIGYSAKTGGYISITRGENKYRDQHVVIMEEIIGRKLTRNEVVHHKDRNKHNNTPSNLELMTRSAHTRLHRLEGW